MHPQNQIKKREVTHMSYLTTILVIALYATCIWRIIVYTNVKVELQASPLYQDCQNIQNPKKRRKELNVVNTVLALVVILLVANLATTEVTATVEQLTVFPLLIAGFLVLDGKLSNIRYYVNQAVSMKA